MAQFVLTAQLQLQAPRNASKVVNQIQNQLKGVQIPVTVKSAAQATKQINQVTAATNKAASAAEAMGKSFGLAIKRFAAFTVASRAVSLFTNSLASAVDEAIGFQREVVKIAQVTGKTVKELKGLEQTITRLSTTLGTSSKELLSTARILSQAGIKAGDLTVAIEALAKTTLAPTFEDINKTAEGAVAILAQFEGGVGRLEKQLGAINAVAGQFAVESGDLIAAVRRFGGVFKSAGGELEELLALFTSVRATTRESSESIATGLRTIFTRIQRPKTIEFLRQFGVELLNAEGKFIGPLKAVEQLNKAFAGLDQGDITFVRVAEELGGFRQIGKVIPLIQQYGIAVDALSAAQEGQNSLSADAEKAQQALAVQITKVKEEFLALVRGIAGSDSFQLFARTALEVASALIKVADAIRPLIPLIGALAAVKFARGLGGFAASAGSALKGLGKNQGGVIQAFARGGFVPGSGNRDTVPAMLTPGEFVIKKSSAKKLGAGTLQQMNENRFAGGGFVEKYKEVGVIGFVPGKTGIIDADGRATPGTASGTKKQKSSKDVIGSLVANNNLVGDQKNLSRLFSATKGKANQLPPTLIGTYGPAKTWGGAAEALVKQLGFGSFTSGTAGISTDGFGRTIPDPDQSETTLEQDIINTTTDSIGEAIGTVGRRLAKTVGVKNVRTKKAPQTIIDQIGIDSIAGKIFEGGITVIDGKPFDEKTSANLAPFDFPNGIGAAKGTIETLAKLEDLATDAKKTVSNTVVKDVATSKVNNAIAQDILDNQKFRTFKNQYDNRKLVNKGGSIGGSGDTVPALLTPGEFVINKGAAQSIGYGNLNSMNRTGVARFNKGGAVQMFANGGTAGGGGGVNLESIFFLTAVAGTASAAIEKFGDKSIEASDQTAALTIGLGNAVKGLIQLLTIGALTLQTRKSIQEWANATDESSKKSSDAEANAQQSVEGLADKIDNIDLTTLQANTVNVDGQKASGDADAATSRPVPDEPRVASTKEVEDKFKAAEEARLEQNRPAARQAILDVDRELEAESQSRKEKRSENKELQSGIIKAKQEQTEVVEQKRALETKQRQGAESGDLNFEQLIELEKQIGELDEQAASYNTTIENNSQKIRDNLNAIEASSDKTKELKDNQKLYGKALKESRSNLGPVSKGVDKLTFGTKRLSAAAKTQAIKGYTATINKANKVYKTSADAIKKGSRRIGGAISTVAKKNFPTFIRAGKAVGRGMSALNKDVVKAGKAIGGLAQRIKKLGGRAGGALRGGLAKGGGLRRGIGAVGGVATVAVGAVAAIATVGNQIADGFQQWFKRAEEQAKASDNIAGAIQAAGQASLAQSIGEIFSIQGFIEAVADPAGFVQRRQERKEQAEFQSAQSFIATRQEASAQRIKDGGDIGESLAGVNEAFAKSRAEAQDLTGAAREKALRSLDARTRQEIGRLDKLGLSVGELRQQAVNLAGADQELLDSLNKQIDTIEANRVAQEQLNKANIDATKIVSAFGAAANASARLVAGLETGANSLALLSDELDNASGKLGVDASGAITEAESQLLSNLPANSPLAASIRGQADVARGTNAFGLNIASNLGNLELARGEEGKGQLEKALFDAIPTDADPATRAKLEAVIRKNVAGIEGDVANADLDALTQQILEDGQELSKGFREAVKLQSQHNATMTKLYADREQLEQKAAAAANQAIETQLEAAKVFESFGGSRLTGEQQLGARIAQFNNIGGLGGLGAQLTTGSAADINAVAAQIGQTFAEQTDQVIGSTLAAGAGLGRGGPFQGAGGFAADKRPEAQAANKALIQFTKQRISLLKEELNIVKQKNAAEKSALDKLISGDVEGFLDQQAAAGAGAALASGSAGLAGLFSASALGAGFKTLEGQGLSAQELRGAENLTLQRFGIQGTGVLSNTTAEQQALNAEGRELAGALGGLASQEAAFAKAEIAIQDATINAAQLSFDRTLADVQRAQGAQGLARGGIVYASRGMFVPRGTDTVPAMLTPGEFVVNRAAVNRGNNLQILRAMNTGGGASAPGALSGGGSVRYYNDGGFVDGITSVFANALPGLTNIFSGFAETVEKLVNTKFNVALDPTNINVNFNGASFLETLKDDIKDGLLTEVGNEIQKYKANNSGDLIKKDSVL